MINGTQSHPSGSQADPTGRQRTSTLRRSCEACRAVKARCVVEPTESPDRPRCCKRCMNQGLTCVFENALARPKKLRYSARTRVKDVEEKLDGLIALISARKEAANQDASPSLEQTPPMPTPAPVGEASNAAGMDFNMTGVPPANFHFPAPVNVDYSFEENFPYLEPQAPPQPPPCPTVQSTTGDVIDRGLINEDHAQMLLTEFIANSEQLFPFVLLPPFVTLSTMRRDRPILLLGILTAASDVPLQGRLELEFRKTIAQIMIVESKKSLDILQGLLIFCMWNHRYCKPFDSQLYQLSQIAVTMAVDLDLPNVLAPILNSDEATRCPSALRPVAKGRTATDQYIDDIERARTYIGTFYMSSSIAMAHRKPTHLKFDRRIEQISRYLANAQEARSDVVLLPHHVRVRKFLEDIDRAFGPRNSASSITMDEKYIEAIVQEFEHQYKEIKDALPAEAWNNASLKCLVLSLPTAIYEVGLQTPAGHHSVLQASPSTPCCDWCGSSVRLSIITKGILAAQSYIEVFLGLPNPVFRQSTIVEICRHIDAFLVLTRAALGFDTKQFQVGNQTTGRVNLIEMAQLSKYIEMSERKLDSLTTLVEEPDGTTGPEEKHDVYWKMKAIFRFSKLWYRKHVQQSALDGGVEKVVQLDAQANAKLQGSSMFWLSEGSAMSKVSCDFPDLESINLDRDSEELDRLMNKLKDCTEAMRAAAGASAMPAPDAEATPGSATSSGCTMSGSASTGTTMSGSTPASMSASASASASVSVPASVPTSVSASASASASAPTSTVTPDAGFGVPPESIDFGVTASWVPDSTTDLWDTMPPSSSLSPWFNMNM